MKTLGNIIWFLFGGFICFIGWSLAGILCSITIIGIPFGLQCFKIAAFVLWPFKKQVDVGNFGAGGFIGNIIWIILLGWELALAHFVTGLIFYITIIGIPFGKQHMKFASLALIPFGATIYDKN